MTNTSAPALLQIVENEVGGKFDIRSNVFTLTQVNSVIAKHDFERVGLIIVNTGNSDIAVFPDSNLIVGEGIILVKSGGQMSLTPKNDFILPGLSWSAHSITTTNTSVYVLELLRYSER